MKNLIEDVIQEVFDSSVNFKDLSHGKYYSYEFEIDGYDVDVQIEYEKSEELWELTFSIDGSITKFREFSKADVLKLFGTLKKILKKFIKEEDPEVLIFAGKGNSKQKLYNMLAKLIAKEHKAFLGFDGHGDTKIYVLEF